MMVRGRPNLPQIGLIDRYLARSIATPLLGSLILAAMLLVLDKMLRLFQYVVDAGGPVSVVWRMLANLLPEYLALGIPIGLMLGILLAFRKLALSSELDALRGIGIGYGRLLRVPFAYAIPLALMNLFIVGYLEPFTHYRYEGLRFDLKSGALGAAIKVGEFNRLGKHLTLRIDRSENKGTQLHGIFVQSEDGKGMSVAATAEHGRFLATDDPDKILFRLPKAASYRIVPSSRHPARWRSTVTICRSACLLSISSAAALPARPRNCTCMSFGVSAMVVQRPRMRSGWQPKHISTSAWSKW